MNFLNVTRPRPHALSCAITLSLLMAPSWAAEPKLRLVTQVGGATTARIVRANVIEFDSSKKELQIETRAGNISCGTPPAPTPGELALNLDGVVYPLILSNALLPSEFPADGSGIRHPVNYELSSGNVSVAPAGYTSSDCVSSHSFGSETQDYDLLFEGQQPLAIAEAVYYDVATRVFEVRVADPVLCTSYGSGGVSLALADPNSPDFLNPQVLAGATSVEFRPGSLSLRPASSRPAGSAGLNLQCSTPGAVAGGGAPLPGFVFSSSFEDAEAMAKVAVSLLVAGAPSSSFGRPLGEAVELILRVSNTGMATASNVRVREYAPRSAAFAAGLSKIEVDQAALTDRCVQTGTATECVTGSTGLGFPLSFDLPTLAPGGSVDFVLSRRLANGASTDSGAIGFAAFVDPAVSANSGPDIDLSDNAAWATFAVS